MPSESMWFRVIFSTKHPVVESESESETDHSLVTPCTLLIRVRSMDKQMQHPLETV
jgi:hypothetical protein